MTNISAPRGNTTKRKWVVVGYIDDVDAFNRSSNTLIQSIRTGMVFAQYFPMQYDWLVENVDPSSIDIRADRIMNMNTFTESIGVAVGFDPSNPKLSVFVLKFPPPQC